MHNRLYRSPGGPAVLRGVGFGRLWWAMPVTVVLDTPALVGLYWCTGTHWKDVGRHPLPEEILASGALPLLEQVWVDTDVLMLARPGESHSVWWMWATGRTELRCWYINLESPLERTRLGFDTMDYELDIVIAPDRSGWYWKDESGFNAMVAAGVFSLEQARAIRVEGMRAIQQFQANASPFCDGWDKWSPPPDWKIPVLPTDWDNITRS